MPCVARPLASQSKELASAPTEPPHLQPQPQPLPHQLLHQANAPLPLALSVPLALPSVSRSARLEFLPVSNASALSSAPAAHVSRRLTQASHFNAQAQLLQPQHQPQPQPHQLLQVARPTTATQLMAVRLTSKQFKCKALQETSAPLTVPQLLAQLMFLP